jgi:uncharacterized protein YbjT (DUF2867 family)
MATLYAEIERLIARSGLEWPFLRPRMFATNALFWWAPAVQTNGIVRWPYAAAETAPVHDGDVAAGCGDHPPSGRATPEPTTS